MTSMYMKRLHLYYDNPIKYLYNNMEGKNTLSKCACVVIHCEEMYDGKSPLTHHYIHKE